MQLDKVESPKMQRLFKRYVGSSQLLRTDPSAIPSIPCWSNMDSIIVMMEVSAPAAQRKVLA